MTPDAIFSLLNEHMIEGIMLHDQLFQMFLFLRLNSFAKVQKKRHNEESKARTKLNEYYISHYDKLITDSSINTSNVIPVEWYDKTRYSVEPSDVKKAAIFAFKLWVSWEEDTKKLYLNSYRDLPSDANYLLKLIEDVDKELNEAKDILLYLDLVDYDVIEIMELNNA